MNQIILASHGGLAAGAKDTLEMVLGDVSNVHVVSLARDDKEPITNKVDAMIATFNADDTVYVLTDMLGSSVNNNMVELSKNGTKFTVVSGFNIPLALTLAMSPVPVKGAELAALINEARTGLTNPNAPVEAPRLPPRRPRRPVTAPVPPRSSSHVLTTVCCTARSSLPGPPRFRPSASSSSTTLPPTMTSRRALLSWPSPRACA